MACLTTLVLILYKPHKVVRLCKHYTNSRVRDIYYCTRLRLLGEARATAPGVGSGSVAAARKQRGRQRSRSSRSSSGGGAVHAVCNVCTAMPHTVLCGEKRAALGESPATLRGLRGPGPQTSKPISVGIEPETDETSTQSMCERRRSIEAPAPQQQNRIAVPLSTNTIEHTQRAQCALDAVL